MIFHAPDSLLLFAGTELEELVFRVVALVSVTASVEVLDVVHGQNIEVQ